MVQIEHLYRLSCPAAGINVKPLRTHLSFREQSGSMLSILHITFPTHPFVTLLRATNGVCPAGVRSRSRSRDDSIQTSAVHLPINAVISFATSMPSIAALFVPALNWICSAGLSPRCSRSSMSMQIVLTDCFMCRLCTQWCRSSTQPPPNYHGQTCACKGHHAAWSMLLLLMFICLWVAACT